VSLQVGSDHQQEASMSNRTTATLVILAMVTAFIVGAMIRTPADRCALDPDCATAPVNR
jgi:hypothetical protein